MPNPNDAARAGTAADRSLKLLNSAGPAANTKSSWSEWFGTASGSWLGGTAIGMVGDQAMSSVSGTVKEAITAKAAATALGITLAGISGFWTIGVAGMVVMEVVGKALEDEAKKHIPSAVQAGREAIGRAYYGGGDPSIVLNRPIGDKTLEETLERIKTNSALLQDLLNKIAGKGGKAYFCDDVYQIAVLFEKCAFTKGELARDIALLQSFLSQLEQDLNKIDPVDIKQDVDRLATAVCNANDGRHWDNSWTAATLKRMSKCSKEHCFGPK